MTTIGRAGFISYWATWSGCSPHPFLTLFFTSQHQGPILSPPEFASIIHDMVGGKSHIIHKDAMEDDPQRRKPDITRANNILGWQPLVSVAIRVAAKSQHFTAHTSSSKQRRNATGNSNTMQGYKSWQFNSDGCQLSRYPCISNIHVEDAGRANGRGHDLTLRKLGQD